MMIVQDRESGCRVTLLLLLFVFFVLLAAPSALAAQFNSDGSLPEETDAGGSSYGDQEGAKDPYADPYDGHPLPGTSFPPPLDVGHIGNPVSDPVIEVAKKVACIVLALLNGATVGEATEACSGD